MSSKPSDSSTSRIRNGINRLEDIEERTDVAMLHAAVMREKSEPKEGQEPLSLWLVSLMSALLFWGGFYLQRYSGGYKPLEYDEHALGASSAPAVEVAEDLYTQGKRLYPTTCGNCHKDDGMGVPNQYPPLVGSDWVLAAGTARIIRIALDGLKGPITVSKKSGIEFNNQNSTMVPWRVSILSDQDIAALLTYVRGQKDWGNNAAEVKPEHVKAIRDKTKDHAEAGQWTTEELLRIPEVEP